MAVKHKKPSLLYFGDSTLFGANTQYLVYRMKLGQAKDYVKKKQAEGWYLASDLDINRVLANKDTYFNTRTVVDSVLYYPYYYDIATDDYRIALQDINNVGAKETWETGGNNELAETTLSQPDGVAWNVSLTFFKDKKSDEGKLEEIEEVESVKYSTVDEFIAYNQGELQGMEKNNPPVFNALNDVLAELRVAYEGAKPVKKKKKTTKKKPLTLKSVEEEIDLDSLMDDMDDSCDLVIDDIMCEIDDFELE